MTDSPSAERRIVVGVDGSAHSKNALRWAGQLAKTFGTRLDAVSAWDYPVATSWASVPQDWHPDQDTEKILQETLREVFGDQPPAGLRAEIGEGSAAKVLIEASVGATMLVVGSRGHGGFAGLLLGSVSANVAEHAKCPVLIVHGNQPLPG